MENKELIETQLEKIITKAELNGFQFRTDKPIEIIEYIGFGRFCVQFENTEEGKEEQIFEFHINELFFNHNFAKAFFGSIDLCSNCGNILKKIDWLNKKCTECSHQLIEENDSTESWAFHLQQMVTFQNPLDYLQQFI